MRPYSPHLHQIWPQLFYLRKSFKCESVIFKGRIWIKLKAINNLHFQQSSKSKNWHSLYFSFCGSFCGLKLPVPLLICFSKMIGKIDYLDIFSSSSFMAKNSQSTPAFLRNFWVERPHQFGSPCYTIPGILLTETMLKVNTNCELVTNL